jgi:hypothetical protein
MAWAWRHNLAIGFMLGSRKITATLTGGTLQWPVVKCCPQRGVLLQHGCETWLQTVIGGLDGNACYTLGYVLTSSAESSQIVYHSYFRRILEGTNNGMIKLSHQSIQKWFSTWMKPHQLRENCQQDIELCPKCGGAKRMNIRAAKQD